MGVGDDKYMETSGEELFLPQEQKTVLKHRISL